MQETWATSASLDLYLDLPRTRPKAALETALREAVRSGRLAPGTTLPSSRALAQDLGVARNTVADAYGQLVAEGWFAAKHGSGTWVAERAQLAQQAREVQSSPAPQRTRHDLRPGVPDLSAFPRAAWMAAARKALSVALSRDLGYADPRGLEVLRIALAEYVGRARGVAVTPDRIVVCAGLAQGVELLCDVLRGRGADTLAVESYGHPGHRKIATARGMRLMPLQVDRKGAQTNALTGMNTSAVLLTPAHQFPLGVAMSPERRRQAADWAARTGGIVIEDDYDGEFRYDRQAIGALQSLAPDHVVYGGTASKSLVPGLRLGWLALPVGLAGEVAAVKRETTRLNSSIDQLALAEFLTSGGYDRQVRRARLAYRQRRDRLVAALAREVPEVRVSGIAAGLHAVVELPDGISEKDVIDRAATNGLALEGLASCYAGGQQLGPALIVGYATPPGHAFSTAVARLCAVLREVV